MDMDVKLNVWGTPLKSSKDRKKKSPSYKKKTKFIYTKKGEEWKADLVVKGEWKGKEKFKEDKRTEILNGCMDRELAERIVYEDKTDEQKEKDFDNSMFHNKARADARLYRIQQSRKVSKF